MRVYCFIEECNSASYKRRKDEFEETLSFYRFPSSPSLHEKWIERLVLLNRQHNTDKITKNSRICVKHFEPDCFEQFGFSSLHLRPGAVPSIFPRAPTATPKTEKAWNFEFVDIKHIDNPDMSTPSNVLMDENIVPQTETMQPSNQLKTPPAGNVTEEHLQPSNQLKYPPPVIRYPGDITKERLQNMSPISLRKCIRVLQLALKKQHEKVRRLQKQQVRHKKKDQAFENKKI